MFVITGTNVLDGSALVITTNYPFEFLAECGWEFGSIESIDTTEARW